MRAWIKSGIALGAVASMAGGGCSAPPKRVEAPPQYRDWKPDPQESASKPKDVFKPEAATPFWAKAGKPVTTASSTRPSIWNYRPGSLFFNKLKSEPAQAPKVELGNTLSKYFPGLQGRDPGAPLRMFSRGRLGGPAPGALVANGAPAVGRFQPTADVVATGETEKELPVGLKVETSPDAPSGSLPSATNVAQRDEAKAPARSDEQLTSHETAAAEPAKPASEANDGLSLDLNIESPKSKPAPATASAPPAGMDPLAVPEPAPADPQSKPASANEIAPPAVPDPQPAHEPAPAAAPAVPRAKVVLPTSNAMVPEAKPAPAEASPPEPPAPPEAKPEPAKAPATLAPLAPPVEPDAPPAATPAEPPAAEPVATKPAEPLTPPVAEAPAAKPEAEQTPPAMKPANPPSSEPTPTPLPTPDLSGPAGNGSAAHRHRAPHHGRVAAMDLPAAEFPMTYHEQSIQSVLDVNGRIGPVARATPPQEDAPGERTAARWTFFPRLSKMWKPKPDSPSEGEQGVRPVRATYGDVGKKPSRAIYASPSSLPRQ